MKKIVLVSLVFFGLITTQAGASNVTGEISGLLVGRNGHEVYVGTTGNPSNLPCSQNGIHPSFQYGISLENNNAKEILKVLLVARLSGKTIYIIGNGNCADFDNRVEEIAYVIF